MRTSDRRKMAITVFAGGLLILLYFMIFSFSSQDGEASGGVSRYISEKCVELINVVSGRHWTEVVMQGMAEYFEYPIRKLAHFSEYAVMGILVYILLSQWIGKCRKGCFLTVLWVLLSAAGDELHQLFVPGRYGSIWDVLLDTCGGIFGMWVCFLVERTTERICLYRAQKTEKRKM